LRRFFTLFFLILLLGGIATGGVYLYTFDLNSFREEIETLASEKISRPITLGNAHLSFKHGPAFAFDNLTIGTAGEDLYLEVKKVFFRVQVLPLLSGKIQFSEILLENPDLALNLKQTEGEKPPFQLNPEERLLTGELIKSLRVLNGTIRITDATNEKDPEKFTIEKLRFSITDFSLLNAGNIKVEATLLYRDVRSPFSIDGKYSPEAETDSWSNAFYKFKLNIKNLDAGNLPAFVDEKSIGTKLTGSAELNLLIEGIPEKEMTFTADLAGKKLQTSFALKISKAAINGRLRYTGERIDLDAVILTLETDRGRLEIENKIRLTLFNNRLTSVASQGNFSVQLTPVAGQTQPLFFTNSLKAAYSLNFSRTKTGWSSSKGELLLPGIKLLFAGQWHADKARPFDLNLDITEASFTALLDLLPGLDRLRTLDLNGAFTAHFNLTGLQTGPLQTTGVLNLINTHLAIPGPLAELNSLRGTILLDNSRISAKGLQAKLGNSPIRVDLSIPELETPDVTLHVLADSIRADELIFPSKRQFLRNIDGVVRITNNSVFLGPIHVKMDGGTDATVYGSVKNFAEADVALQITGRYGNIDEIIDLWEHDPLPPVPPPVPPSEQNGSLTIDITTDSGQISGMQFDRATSEINRHNQTLVIGPIRFNAGAGEGVGQVLIVHQDDGHSRLKISGEIKNFDAKTVYNQLLKQRGLVTGRLSGNFHLEGVAGEEFIPTAEGFFDVQIEEGRLQKLTGLAKILQVLNLYPLLTENVQGKGLPYETITFTSNLAKGQLATEDFLLQGTIMNLSLAGHYNIINNTVEFDMAAMPLRSVDSILSRIPIAGWLLTGDKKALVIAYFKMSGPAADPEVKSVPLDSVTTPVIGIFKRIFSFPVKIVTDPREAILNR